MAQCTVHTLIWAFLVPNQAVGEPQPWGSCHEVKGEFLYSLVDVGVFCEELPVQRTYLGALKVASGFFVAH